MKRSMRVTVIVATVVGLGAVVAPSGAAPTHQLAPTHHFKPAAHRAPPLFPSGDYKAERLRVVSIVPNGSDAASSVTSRLLWFGTALVHSKWYAALNTAYGLGGSTGLSVGVRANVAGLGHHPSSVQVSSFINQVAHLHKIKLLPDVKTIWVVYFHCATGDTGSLAICASADHETPDLPAGATNYAFGPLDSFAPVMVDHPQWNDNAGRHSQATRNASHEIIEAATDRGDTGYFLPDTDNAAPWLGGSPWTEVQGSDGTEVADQGRVYGQLITYPFVDPAAPSHNYKYDYARVFSNAAARAGGDWSRPASPVPFYDVTVPHDWYQLPTSPNSFVEVPITGWSVQKENSWTLKASLLAWGSQADKAPPPCSTTKSRLAGPDGKTYPLSAGPVMNNGTHASLDVAYNPAATNPSLGTWCLFELKSYRTGKEPGGSGHPDAGGDLYHSWMVGFYY